ncbi:uncharacterized protein [Cherax quadricarinatus]|uniref:uncharacterized protein n=1 Tax=Cherax quadricarinatus TaxID=27406 RepID=UPI00387E6AB5
MTMLLCLAWVLTMTVRSEAQISNSPGSVNPPRGERGALEGGRTESFASGSLVGDQYAGDAGSRRSDGVPLVHHPAEGAVGSVLESLFDLGLRSLEKQKAKEQEEEALVEDIVKLGFDSSISMSSGLGGSTSMSSGLSGSTSTSVEPSGYVDGQKPSPLLRFLKGLRENAWQQLKSMALSYITLLSREYERQDLQEKLPLDLIKNMVNFGDGVNFLHILSKRVDPGLTEHVIHQLKPMLVNLSASTGLQEGGTSFFKRLVRTIALKSIREFTTHVLGVTRRYFTEEDLKDYKDYLALSFPAAKAGLDLILNMPLKSQVSSGGRFLVGTQLYGTNSGYNANRAGHGGYDSGVGYGAQNPYGTSYNYGVYMDPYLVLGSLGAAALLSLLVFKVMASISTTKARSLPENFDTDMIDTFSTLYTVLDDADDKYRHRRSSPTTMDDSDDLIHGINSLWREHQNDFGCVRCSLFRSIVAPGFTRHNVGKDLALVGVAHMLGTERSGQLVDEVAGLVMEGKPVTCEREINTCVLK